MRMGEVPFALFAPPAVPARWELMLRDIGLTEMQALSLLRESRTRLSGSAGCIRQWVRQHFRRAFVPELVLRELGVSDSDVLSAEWTREDGRRGRMRAAAKPDAEGE